MVVLVHGFLRTSRDMAYMQRGLEALGYETFAVNLPTTFGTLDDAVEVMAQQLSVYVQQGKILSFVAHSMGGLIVCQYIKAHIDIKVGTSVFIATPFKGTSLAKIASHIPFFSTLFKLIQVLLPKENAECLTHNSFKLGVIAGSVNTGILGKIFMPHHSDGRVSVESVKSHDADAFITLAYGHHAIHHRKQTLKHVAHFLEHQEFLDS